MKQIVCDKCRKPFYNHECIPILLNRFGSIIAEQEKDLCKKCYKEITKLIAEWFKKK